MQYPEAFQKAVARVLADEGGYVNNPADPGGETNFGISKRSYPDLDIKSLTRDRAIDIYFRDWWTKYGFDRLTPEIGAKLFDLAVNEDDQHAVRTLQRALRACGVVVDEDGNLGPKTVAAANSVANTESLLVGIRCEAASYYRLLAALHHRDEVFLKGWLNRAYE